MTRRYRRSRPAATGAEPHRRALTANRLTATISTPAKPTRSPARQQDPLFATFPGVAKVLVGAVDCSSVLGA
jgi:hypothetical protein